MLFSYDIAKDRFRSLTFDKKPQKQNSIDSFEYFRYLPNDQIFQKKIKKNLVESPYEICFEITKRCNLICPVCIANAKKNSNIFLSLNKIDRAINELPSNIFRATITGGEPTIHPDINSIISSLTKRYATVLSTNGYYPEKIEYISKSYKNLIIAISIHGPKQIHDKYVGENGAFDRAIKSIEVSSQNGSYTHIYTTASEQNLKYISQIDKILSNFKITEHRINLVKDRGRLEIDSVGWDKVYDEIASRKYPYRVTIKRHGQPFLFMSCNGEMEIINE